MRRALSLRIACGLSAILLAPALLLGAAKPILDKPSTRQLQRLAYVKRILIDAYEANGQKDPRWDSHARAAITAFARDLGSDPDDDGDAEVNMFNHAGRALAAGCDDPLIHFCRAKILTRGPGRILGVCKAADKMRTSDQYGPYIRAHVLILAAWWSHSNKALVTDKTWQPNIRENIDTAMALVPDIFAEKDLPAQLVLELLRNIGYASMHIEGDRFVLLDKVNPLLDKSPQPRNLVLSMRGREMSSYAWDAFGRGGVGGLPNGPQLFIERMTLSRKLLEESWEMWPNGEAATEIIHVLKALQAPREEMEMWFSRAMDVDSCNLSACLKKLDFLAWKDEPQEMLKFGREMYENGNWAGRVPETLHHAHWKVAYRTAKRAYFPDREYFKHPQVWKELHEYYEARLARSPQNTILR